MQLLREAPAWQFPFLMAVGACHSRPHSRPSTICCAFGSDIIMTTQNLFARAFASALALKRSAQAVLVASVVFATSQATASSITYAVAVFGDGEGRLGIGGSITTDGTLGSLSASNIIDWNLIGAAQPVPTAEVASIFQMVGPLSGGPNSTLLLLNANIIATPLTLAFGPNSQPNGEFAFIGPLDQNGQFTTLIDISFADPNIAPNTLVYHGQGGFRAATIAVNSLVFADGKEVLAPIATPLPGALPLFATGLGALSLLAWRRKRRNPT